MKKIIVFFLIVFLLISCKPQFTEQSFINTTDAEEYLMQEIENKKIIFIGENHTTVDPILFLSENLQSFYDRGVRYLFLEGHMPRDPNGGADFLCFFPWIDAAWKYEWTLLDQSLWDINNSVSEEEKLQILHAEEGYVEQTSNDPRSFENRMNQRDITAFNNISNIVDNMRDDERVLIFYGSAHGVTNPIKQAYTDSTALFGRRSFMWKSFSAMLKEKYEDDFESFAHVSFNDYMNNHILDNNVINEYSEYHKIIFMEDAKNFDLPHDLKTSLNLYDGFIMDQESTYGIYHQYVPNYENLQFIFSSLKEMEKNTDMFKLEDNYFHWQDQGQYLMYIYYLKLYFGDAFDYQFWNPAKPLAEVLSDLEQNVFVNKETLNENLCFSKDIETLREYHKLMIVSNVLGFVERLPSMDNAWLARDMEKAVELFPEDLWAWYWLAYAKTEDGQYEEAAQLWKYIISQPLAYCMETLPKCYEQLAYCYEQLGDIEKSTKSMTLASGLTNEHGLNVSEYVDMR